MNYYLNVLKKYAVFNGRARRKEYWMFYLFNFVIAIVLGFVGSIIGTTIGVLFTIYSLAILIPSIAVMIRRLHDTNHSGWWWFIGLVPIVGVIILFVFLVRDSQPGENQYGPNPKQVFSNGSSSDNTGHVQSPNQELIDYVKTSLAHGHSQEDIKQILVQAGWPEEAVEEAMRLVR